MADLTDAKRRVVDRLKRAESLTAAELADEFGITDTAIRQHLESLEHSGLVTRADAVAGARGRPAVQWRATAMADSLYADRHDELSVDLIQSVRDTLGEQALQRVVRARAERQLSQYRAALAADTTLVARARRLARLRTDEGYQAESSGDDRAITLIEHHCPIRQAAQVCGELCASELTLFRDALGPDVQVEREQHLLAGHHRCTYRITPSRITLNAGGESRRSGDNRRQR